jgi:hypothetical protein
VAKNLHSPFFYYLNSGAFQFLRHIDAGVEANAANLGSNFANHSPFMRTARNVISTTVG